MSIYQRGENWYIDFRFKGQRIRESIGPSRKDAEKIIAKNKTEVVENKYLDIRKEPDPIKFHDLAKEYLKWAKTNKKASTYSRDISIMRGLDKEFEGKNIQDVTSWLIEKWKSKRSEKFKPGSVNREPALLKHIFSKALEWKRIKENPAQKVKRLKGETKRVRYLMPDEIQTLLSHCEGLLRYLLRPMVTLALHTGARKGELQGLEWSNVNFDLGFISLLDTKNAERRDIPMNETVRATLKAMEQRGSLVFSNRNGNRIDSCALYLAFYEALRKSKIEDFKFHDLRHTFASNLVMQEGVELNDVRELLGHKKMDMTLRYAHLSPKHKTKVVNVLDRVMSQNPPQAQKVVNLSR
jgi:integrase